MGRIPAIRVATFPKQIAKSEAHIELDRRLNRTPHQVAEALVEYYDLGVTTFLIRGFNPLADTIAYGRDLLPLTRKLIAERSAARAA